MPRAFHVFRNRKLHVQAQKCDTCIFLPGNLMDLAPGRVAGMVDDATKSEGHIPCHETTYRRGVKPAVCRGFYDLRYARPHALFQLAERLGLVKFEGEA